RPPNHHHNPAIIVVCTSNRQNHRKPPSSPPFTTNPSHPHRPSRSFSRSRPPPASHSPVLHLLHRTLTQPLFSLSLLLQRAAGNVTINISFLVVELSEQLP
ncbi:hypothetical protein HN873_055178, partial [Arachis hypogaea]